MANSGIIARGGFPNQTNKAIDERFSEANLSVLSQWAQCFKEVPPSPGKSRYTSQLSGLKDFEVVAEGGVPTMDVPVEGWTKENLYIKYGRGFQVTQEMLQDSLDDNIMQMATSLGTQAEQKINTVAFAFVESGFATATTPDTATPFLFSASHYVLNSSTAYSNLATAALSESSLQAMFESFDKLVDHSGNPSPKPVSKILIHPDNRFTASKLWSGDRIIGSNDNDPNTVNPSFGVMSGWNYEVVYYLSDSESWYGVGGNLEPYQGFQISFKKKPDLRFIDDESTEGRIYYSTSRFQVFANDWRGLYGSTV